MRKASASLVASEHQEQAAFVQWMAMQYPKVRLFAIPNGGQRNAIVAAKLKAEGVSPGVPDIYVPEWSTFIEMKRRTGGKLSKHQKEWIAYLEGCGYRCLVCRGAIDAMEQVRGLFK